MVRQVLFVLFVLSEKISGIDVFRRRTFLRISDIVSPWAFQSFSVLRHYEDQSVLQSSAEEKCLLTGPSLLSKAIVQTKTSVKGGRMAVRLGGPPPASCNRGNGRDNLDAGGTLSSSTCLSLAAVRRLSREVSSGVRTRIVASDAGAIATPAHATVTHKALTFVLALSDFPFVFLPRTSCAVRGTPNEWRESCRVLYVCGFSQSS